MKPAAFRYQRIAHPDEVVAALAQAGDDARVLAGGQSLMPILNMRLAQPKALLDISRCAPLDEMRIEQGTLVVGAAVTQSTLERRATLASEAPLLALALPHIAHMQIRNRGTVCGSLAHADPSAELPLCLTALDGEVVLRSLRGERVVRAADFFQGALLTDRAADELVVAARFPLTASDTGVAFEEFALRHGDYAIVSVAVVGNAHRLRVAVGGVADSPVALDLPALDGGDLDDALNEFAWRLQARDDAQASARTRRHLVRQLGRRAVEQARRDATERANMQATKQATRQATKQADGPASAGATPAPASGDLGREALRAEPLDADATRRITLTINGQRRTGEAGARTLLSDFLRHELGLTGTHVGCEHGVCGACTVRIDGAAQRACLTLAMQAEQRTLQTVECQDDGDALLRRLRDAFKRHHALQCGYCTAGILMSSVEFLSRVRHPDEAQVRAMLAGHLCRCTGYTPIVAAVLAAAAAETPADV